MAELRLDSVKKKREYVLVDGCSEGETWEQALERHRKNQKLKKNISMCLIIDNNYHKGTPKKYRIADFDFDCYKVVCFDKTSNKLLTGFQKEEISLDDRFLIPDYFQEEAKRFNKIDHGIHAFSNCFLAIGYATIIQSNNKDFKVIVLRCTIKKGTKYWVGDEKDICAEKLEIGDESVSYFNIKGDFTRLPKSMLKSELMKNYYLCV